MPPKTADSKIKFELAGSHPHYPPSYDFELRHLHLRVEPDLVARTISGRATITVRALEEIETIALDSVDLQIISVEDTAMSKELPHFTRNNKLVIDLDTKLAAGDSATIAMNYTATPRKGFYFIGNDKYYPDKRLEGWTQGQTTEARHWFPSIDHPQAKFTVDLEIIAPQKLDVISNGLRKLEPERISDAKVNHHWSMNHPIPAYLLSVVIGEYDKYTEGRNLFYYVPKGTPVEVKDRTFAKTADMIQFFEDYFGVPYPYEKYSQITVQDFLAQGMENASCSTLTADTLHDKRAELDYPSENLVAHEIAHQWFGDLVTCSDWQHLWLNEGFATYCEALYQQECKGDDDYYQMIMANADSYFEEAASRYTRPVVTNIYKHPDDLFDTHSYAKGACVIHTLRHLLGNEIFRNSVKAFLKQFSYGTAETCDLIRVFESQSGKNLRRFFKQWIFMAGHPDLAIAFLSNRTSAIFRIQQMQKGILFDFVLEARVAFENGNEERLSISVSDKQTTLTIPLNGRTVNWFSINPEFGALVNVISIDAPVGLLVNQLRHGKTIVERIQAARALNTHSTSMAIDALKESVLGDRFWSVSAEAAKSLGRIKKQLAYSSLKDCVGRLQDPRVKRAAISGLGKSRTDNLIEFLDPLIRSDTETYSVQSEAYAAIGKTHAPEAVAILKRVIASGGKTHLDVVATGAIRGLKEFSNRDDIQDFILRLCEYGKVPKIREAATSALGAFASRNPKVANYLQDELLRDKWFRVRRNACTALVEAEVTGSIPHLRWVAENDIDASVRRVADECIIMLEQLLLTRQRRVVTGARALTVKRDLALLRKERARRIAFLSKVNSGNRDN